MKLLTTIACLVAAGTFIASAGRADAFTCNNKAIHEKAQYVLGVWDWVNSDASNDAAPSKLLAKIEKIWDGQGDCNGNEDTSSFTDQTRVDLVTTHFYGDMITVAFMVGAKQYDSARKHYDDWTFMDKTIRKNPSSFTDQLVADDQRNRGRMAQFDSQLTKLGYPPSKDQ